MLTEDEIVERLIALSRQGCVIIFAPLLHGVRGSHRTLLEMLQEAFGSSALWVDGRTWDGTALRAADAHDITEIMRRLDALDTLGLGYVALDRPSPTLSRGEAQRVKLARYLGRRSLSGQLLVLDEPSTGLHPQDVGGLLRVLDRLVRAGATVVVGGHNTDMIRAADWIVDLGPGSGPDGGRLLCAGCAMRATAWSSTIPCSSARRITWSIWVRVRALRAGRSSPAGHRRTSRDPIR